jgi:hypothetical protein
LGPLAIASGTTLPYLEILFFLASGLLVLTGAFKLWKPQPTAKVLGAIGITRHSLETARMVGGTEIAVGSLGLAWPRGPGGTAVAALYLAFAGFLAFLIAFRPSVRSCGCTGRRDVPPNLLHAGLDVGAALIAFVVATSPARSLAAFLGSLQAEGVLALVVALFLGYALYGAVAYLPQALKVPRRAPVPKRHGGEERARLVDEIFSEARIPPDDPSLWGGIRNGATAS